MIPGIALLVFCYGVARLLLDTTRKADGQSSMFGNVMAGLGIVGMCVALQSVLAAAQQVTLNMPTP